MHAEIAGALLSDEHPTVKRAKRLIKERLAERPTLVDIAGGVHITPEYLCALFKRECGTAVMSYVRSELIDPARRMIIGGVSLEAVAERCGFSNHSSFSHCFKRVSGLSPTEFKRSIGR